MAVSIHPTEAVNSFSIISQILNDPLLAPRPDAVDFQDQTGEFLSVFLDLHAAHIKRYTSQWRVNAFSCTELAASMEELTFLTVVLYGIGGWRAHYSFRADFFLYVGSRHALADEWL